MNTHIVLDILIKKCGPEWLDINLLDKIVDELDIETIDLIFNYDSQKIEEQKLLDEILLLCVDKILQNPSNKKQYEKIKTQHERIKMYGNDYINKIKKMAQSVIDYKDKKIDLIEFRTINREFYDESKTMNNEVDQVIDMILGKSKYPSEYEEIKKKIKIQDIEYVRANVNDFYNGTISLLKLLENNMIIEKKVDEIWKNLV